MLSFQTENALITPVITLSGDGPCQWEVVEGDGDKFYYVGNSFSHDRIADGAMTVRLLNTQQVAPFVTSLNFPFDGIFSDINQLQLPRFTSITSIVLNSQQLTGGVGLTLPQTVTTLQVPGNTLATFPRLTFPSPISTYQIGTNAFTQTQVDEIIDYVFLNRFDFTAGTPSFAVGGGNASPSGVYQLANPPTTGKEKIYWLVNDPLAEGFNKQTWTYTL